MDEKTKQPEDTPEIPAKEKIEESPSEVSEKNKEEVKTLEKHKEPEISDKAKHHGKKAEKSEVKKEVKKDGHKDDFRYIVRMANTDLDGNKSVVVGITHIKGIGRRLSILIADKAGVNRYMKIGDLSDAQIAKIKEVLESLSKTVPSWMLNHRAIIESGENIHVISTDVDTRLRDDINFMKMIKSYRGVRHEFGLPVRGQRTKSNGRFGLAMGVSKKAQPASSGSSEQKKSKE